MIIKQIHIRINSHSIQQIIHLNKLQIYKLSSNQLILKFTLNQNNHFNNCINNCIKLKILNYPQKQGIFGMRKIYSIMNSFQIINSLVFNLGNILIVNKHRQGHLMQMEFVVN